MKWSVIGARRGGQSLSCDVAGRRHAMDERGCSEHFRTRPIFRPTVLDRTTVESGRELAASAQAEAETARRERNLQTRAAAAAAQIGLRIRGGRSSETRTEAAEELAKLMSEASQNEVSE